MSLNMGKTQYQKIPTALKRMEPPSVKHYHNPQVLNEWKEMNEDEDSASAFTT